MSRSRETYRAARRNACRRDHTTWTKDWYYANHDAKYIRATQLKRSVSKYHPNMDLFNRWQMVKLMRKMSRKANESVVGIVRGAMRQDFRSVLKG